MYGALDISTSGLVAQRIRLDTISGNLANLNTILNAEGEYEPFQRRFAVLAAGDQASGASMGVRVASVESDKGELRMKFEPDSPYADVDGYVGYPDVDPVIEQMNAMEATRSYEANITAIEATKLIFNSALQILT
jgi:flagellar basal-body rod protein FlgC